MKKVSKSCAIIAFILLITNLTQGQNQKFTVYQDQVIPAMQAEYEKATKEFIEVCKKNNLQNADWNAIQFDDGRYAYVSTIDKMADLDRNWFAPLEEKIGKENLQKYFDRLDKCYSKNGNFQLTQMKDLCYMPNGLNIRTEGEDYRRYHYFYVSPSNSKAMQTKFKEITALFTKKNAKEYYRIYHSGYGVIGEYYMVAISAKDEQAYVKTSDEVNVLLGKEWQTMFNELFVLADKYENISGRMRPDLSLITKK